MSKQVKLSQIELEEPIVPNSMGNGTIIGPIVIGGIIIGGGIIVLSWFYPPY